MKFRRIILSAVGFVAIACLVEFAYAAILVANTPEQPPFAAELDSHDTAEVPTAVPTLVPTLSLADALTAIARDVTEDRLIDARLHGSAGSPEPGVTATVVYSLTRVDATSTVLSAAIDLRRVAPRVFAETNVDWLIVKMESGFTDITGHDVTRDAFIFILSRAVNKAIDWPNFNVGNLELIDMMAGDGSMVYVHPALQYAWDAYRTRH